MHLLDVKIENIRSLRSVKWSVSAENAAGWHVIIGDNGSGKTTFVRSVALALVGPFEASALRQNWGGWLRKEAKRGEIRLSADWDADRDPDFLLGLVGPNSLLMNIVIDSTPMVGFSSSDDPAILHHVWGKTTGWFSAAYGPYRRFSGKNIGYEDISRTNPKLAAHLSVFDESFALGESLEWLQELKFKQLEKNPAGNLLDAIKIFINQDGFLPYDTKLQEISSDGVTFVDGNGCTLPVEDLSDGYRSVLSMTLELIRQMSRSYPNDVLFSEDGTKVMPPGVVLIDEVDAHLHPSWQRKIGLWFREHFPNVQFIVTTHSPLVCQAAEHGSVWRLPKPGTDEQGGMVTGVELDRLLYGNVLDAYSTDLFGSGTTRSDQSREKLERLAELNLAERDRTLVPEERQEQQRLRAMMPTAAYTVKVAAET